VPSDVSSSSKTHRVQVKLNRNFPPPALEKFTDYFQGFEKVEAVRSVFGERTEKVLGNLKVGFMPNKQMYMGIRDVDGNIAVGTYHLRVSPTRTLYLDIIHELFHINQRMNNPKFFHDEFMKFMGNRALYYASPIEIPAYEHTVREAERIGMTREQILGYLKFGYAPPKTWKRFVKEMKLKKGKPTSKKITRFPVKIRRETSPKLLPFAHYFKGFETADAVQRILGDHSGAFLGGLKVEFIDSPFPTIYPSEEDGHLIVASDYFRRGTVTSVYLDVILSLSILKELGGTIAARGDPFAGPGMLRAYSEMVKEARRIGLPDGEILTHLRLPSFFLPAAEYKKFLKALGLKPA